MLLEVEVNTTHVTRDFWEANMSASETHLMPYKVDPPDRTLAIVGFHIHLQKHHNVRRNWNWTAQVALQSRADGKSQIALN